MKFYKVHAAKFKTHKVFFVPEQFDEIGPDAFSQTNFEIIVLSRKVKTIKNHAFSDLKKCKVYIPKTVGEIEPLAFENIDLGNEFYCVNGSEAFKICVENELKVNEDIETFIEHAEALKLEEEKQLKAIAEQNKSIQPKVEKKEIEKKSETTDIQEFEETKEDKPQVIENDLEVIPETTVEYKVVVETSTKRPDDDLFIEKYGLPPVVEFYSDMGEGWKKQISQMNTEDIISNYDSNEYCEEYRYYCYIELRNRFLENKMHIKPVVQEENIVSKITDELGKKEPNDELIIDQSEEDEIMALLGVPPKCSKTSGFNVEWKQQIKVLSTREVLERYDSEEWCEEYRYLCYQELSKRKDLENVLFESE